MPSKPLAPGLGCGKNALKLSSAGAEALSSWKEGGLLCPFSLFWIKGNRPGRRLPEISERPFPDFHQHHRAESCHQKKRLKIQVDVTNAGIIKSFNSKV